jgi:dipeptidyl aminopeptidase/acylaminoacyl peptidase
MKTLTAIVLTASVAVAASKTARVEPKPPELSLGRLFTRPWAWGTAPTAVKWSKTGHTLVFLWNSEGRRFQDLYAYDPDTRNLLRLTSLEGLRDDLNRNEAQKDERRRSYVLPEGGVGGFDLPQDGSQAAFSYLGDLWVVKTDASASPLRLTHTKAAETNPQFSPDGSRLAFLRGGALIAQDLRTGQQNQLTDAEDVTWFRWAPDGRNVAYSVRGSKERQLPLPNYSGKTVAARQFSRSLAGDGPGETKYFVVSATADNAQPLLLENGPWGAKVWSENSPEWSPDGKSLLRTVVKADHKTAQVLVYDGTTGRAKVVFETKDPAWVDQIQTGWSPDSASVYLTCDQDGYSHLYRVAADASEKPRQITSGKWEIRSESSIYSQRPQWVGDYLYYTSTEAGTAQRQFYRIHPDGSGKEQLSTGEGIHVGIVSEDGQHRAEMRADLNHPLTLWVDGAEVAHRIQPAFETYRWPETRFFSFSSKNDGKMVSAKMLLPPGYNPEDRSKQWPAIFFIHGSGIATSVLEQWGSYVEIRYVFNAYMAQKGYVVFDLDYRGSTGYGRDWRTGVYLDMGGPDLEDVLGEIEYTRTLGNIDMDRIGIWGVSYGGFMTDMAMFRAPEVFRAGAAFAAVNDWENYNAEYTEERLNQPEENLEAYRRSSPIWYSQQLRNPLLIVHGFVDDNVLFQDAVQLTQKLIHEGKAFEEMFYPEESHGFVRDETLIDSFGRTAAFFDRHLGARNGK